MKNIIYIGFISLFLLSSCDKIEMPYIETLPGVVVTVTFPPLDRSSVYRKILVEEYTGHTCTNCPDGHDKISELSMIFGDTLVPIGIHATSFANPISGLYKYDFRVKEGLELAKDFEIYAIPVAVINRTKFGGNELGLLMEQWQNAIQNVSRTIYAGIQIKDSVMGGTLLNVYTKTTMLEEYNSPLRLSVFLVEDNIIKPQRNGTQDIEDYSHNHVLRASFNGTYGVTLTSDGILTKDSAYIKGYGLDFKEKDWKMKDCSIVVILHDPVTKEVLQVEVLKQK